MSSRQITAPGRQEIRRPYLPPITHIGNIPNMNMDLRIIDNTFTLVLDGDINKIKTYLINNKAVLTLQSPQSGDNILHQIIRNELLTPSQKYELVKFAINNGVSVSTPNNINVTPLHLAVQIQDKKITELLLNNGANVNATDSKSMTPLHYAVQGNIVACAPNKTIKIIPPDAVLVLYL